MFDPNPIRPPKTWFSNPKLIKIKTGFTTKTAGLSYRRVFYNSVCDGQIQRREKRKRRRNRTYKTISQQTSIV